MPAAQSCGCLAALGATSRPCRVEARVESSCESWVAPSDMSRGWLLAVQTKLPPSVSSVYVEGGCAGAALGSARYG